jgi:anti-sigma regulatory factor (Ser/Thr protein kinase)
MSEETARVSLPATASAPRAARAIVAEHCASWDTDSVETALLLTSELVTNAVRHGRSDVRLQVAVDGDLLRVDVGDDNSRHPLRKPSDLGALDGRGLQIVELLALRWGVDDEPLGKRVWFELSR